MTLSPEQLSSIADWFAAGASLDEIQKRLKSEFGVHITYLDLRLLVADLPQPKDDDDDADAARGDALPPAAEAPNGDGMADASQSYDAAHPEDSSSQDGDSADDGAQTSTLSVTVDPITPPGVVAGGGVTFSDGTSGKWYLDQMGRLGLGGLPQGYRPSPEDAALFQTRLMEALQSKGLM